MEREKRWAILPREESSTVFLVVIEENTLDTLDTTLVGSSENVQPSCAIVA